MESIKAALFRSVCYERDLSLGDVVSNAGHLNQVKANRDELQFQSDYLLVSSGNLVAL